MPAKPRDDYIEVAERLIMFYDKYPDGRLQTVVVKFCQWPQDGIFAQAEAYRAADDPKPGIGSAWEPVPGKTPFTRDSEVQNAETAAWGRAMAACGIAANRGIASREDVAARQPDSLPVPHPSVPTHGAGTQAAPHRPGEDARSTIDLREGELAKDATPAQKRMLKGIAGPPSEKYPDSYNMTGDLFREILGEVTGSRSMQDLKRADVEGVLERIHLVGRSLPR